jgi:hypothetical protein
VLYFEIQNCILERFHFCTQKYQNNLCESAKSDSDSDKLRTKKNERRLVWIQWVCILYKKQWQNFCAIQTIENKGMSFSFEKEGWERQSLTNQAQSDHMKKRNKVKWIAMHLVVLSGVSESLSNVVNIQPNTHTHSTAQLIKHITETKSSEAEHIV